MSYVASGCGALVFSALTIYMLLRRELLIVPSAGTGTEPQRTSSGTGTFKILRTGTGTFILMYKVPEPNWNFYII